MVADTREYDLFGPWVEEVRTAQDVPRLFRSHPLDLAAARRVLKVPRNIARRDATPEMDLYDHLLALEPDRLTVLTRAEEGGVRVRHRAYADVVAIHHVVNLLDGRVHLHTIDGRVLTVPYNGADTTNPRRLVEDLRSLAAVEWRGGPARGPATLPQPPPVVLEQAALGVDDMGPVNAFRTVAGRRPGLTARAWHGRRQVRPAGGGLPGARDRVSHALSPMTLHAAVLAGDDDSLEVFGRQAWLVRGRAPEHSASRLVVLTRTLDAVESRPHPVYPEATVVDLCAGRARVNLVVPRGSPAERLLVGLR